MMEKNKLYLLIAIVVIVAAAITLFAWNFVASGDENLVGACQPAKELDCVAASGDVIKGGCGSNTNSPEAQRCRNNGGTCKDLAV